MKVPGTYAQMPRTIDGIPGTVTRGFRERPIRELPVERFARSLDGLVWAESVERHRYKMGDCNIMVSREPAGPDRALLWHLSISTPHRHPTWDEIKVARYRLLPNDITFAMVLPPPDEYVNIETQDHVFHLWEIPGERPSS